MLQTINTWIETNSEIIHNSIYLIATMVMTSGSGFVYWWLAAREFSPEVVGLASASVSAMMLLGTIGMLGLGTLLIGELPKRSDDRFPLIFNALMIVGLAGGALGLLFALVIPLFLPDFDVLHTSPVSIALFAAGVSLTSVSIVLDQAFVGLLRSQLQLVRNTIFALVKLAALLFLGLFLFDRNGMGIYLTWAVGNLISVAYFGWVFAHRLGLHRSTLSPEWNLLRKLGLPAVQHHILNLSLLAPGLLLPVLVTAILSSRMNAYFYAAWMIASIAFYSPIAITTILFAVGSAEPDVIAHKFRFTMKLSLITGVLMSAGLFVGAYFVLNLFKASYASEATWCLRILAFGFFPLIIKNHFVADCRIKKRMKSAILLTACGALGEIVFASIGAKLSGLTGLSLGWLVGLTLEAIWMTPPVLKAIRASSLSQDEQDRSLLEFKGS